MPTPLMDVTGQRFGRLLAVAISHKRRRQIYWLCVCDCGTETTATGPHLRTGRKASCGCIKREHLVRLSSAKVTHGLTHTAEYGIWGGIIDRCNNPKNKNWPRYGGRGITVCARWLHFENFLADMGARPDARLSIDRVDNDGHYAPGNCRWATAKEQRHNQGAK